MAIVSSKEFNQRASAVLKLSETEPVYITKWGKVVSVLASYHHYQAQTKPQTLASVFSAAQTNGVVEAETEQAFEQILGKIRQESSACTPNLAEWE